jgi:hypothetical protein
VIYRYGLAKHCMKINSSPWGMHLCNTAGELQMLRGWAAFRLKQRGAILLQTFRGWVLESS